VRCRNRVALLLIVTILVSVFTMATDEVEAKPSSTQEQLQQTQQEVNALEGKLDEITENLEGLQGTQSSLKKELNKLNEQLSQVSANLADLEIQIEDKELEIQQTQKALEEAKATEAWQYDCMVIRVRDMYEQNDTGYINAILNAGSLADILNAADYFEKIASYDRMKLEEFKENRKLIEEHEVALQADRVELENLKVEAEAQRNQVAGLISQTANSIAAYADEIAQAEAEAEAYEAELKKKEEDLEYLKKKLEEEMLMSQLAANSTWRDISQVTFAEGDRYLLANLIYCEAGGEPYAGQLAVGAVVMNRVMSSVYPNTVVGVIYQRKQFSPAGSGRLELALAQNKATPNCYKAADEAMSGVTNVGNCLYFRTPIPGLTGISIGGHIFY